ncbi:hypothetical protein HBH70_064790 [Parastagonospora nodorum]|nr:hypothetical protein HBH51_048680 [Parastagonospora nodorum]KAH4130324.1 hypothetical protein HBH47_023060 [Parastagonospora nodorum]KAH4165192.1 hypothetical protein HBH43_141500 [Parastagonospora nodorum]KAH4207477.1 hypothetical protein HBI95_104660 [Parastagonospora nodorum]KAH4415274.1 hypothetical protein HBH92_075730 [Parastagonospora nodorum]
MFRRRISEGCHGHIRPEGGDIDNRYFIASCISLQGVPAPGEVKRIMYSQLSKRDYTS